MIGTRRQIELAHRRPLQTLTIILQLARLPYLPRAQIRVTDDILLRYVKKGIGSLPYGNVRGVR